MADLGMPRGHALKLRRSGARRVRLQLCTVNILRSFSLLCIRAEGKKRQYPFQQYSAGSSRARRVRLRRCSFALFCALLQFGG